VVCRFAGYGTICALAGLLLITLVERRYRRDVNTVGRGEDSYLRTRRPIPLDRLFPGDFPGERGPAR
jgi:hypothetical protein